MFKRSCLPLLCFLLVTLPIPAAQAGGCVFISPNGEVNEYVNFFGSNVLQGSFAGYSDANCQTALRHYSNHPGMILTSSPDSAMSTCRQINDAPILMVTPLSRETAGSIFQCILGDPDDTTESQTYEYVIGFVFLDGPSSLEQGRDACIRDIPPSNTAQRWYDHPSTFRCVYIGKLPLSGRVNIRGSAGGGSGVSYGGCVHGIDLPLTGLRLHAFDGMGSGIQFRRLDNCGVGIQSVIDMGFLDAVDIWNNVGSGYEVCFPKIGRIVFLDASTAPRSVVFPEFRFEDGWTCASMGIAGTMVLVNPPAGSVAHTLTPTPTTTTRRPGTDDSIDDAIALETCEITPRANLRLRAAPWGKILDVIPRDTNCCGKGTNEVMVQRHLRRDRWLVSRLAG